MKCTICKNKTKKFYHRILGLKDKVNIGLNFCSKNCYSQYLKEANNIFFNAFKRHIFVKLNKKL